MELEVKTASGRGVCCECGELIPKGAMQFIATKGTGRWAKTSRYCAVHGLPALDIHIAELNKMRTQLAGR